MKNSRRPLCSQQLYEFNVKNIENLTIWNILSFKKHAVKSKSYVKSNDIQKYQRIRLILKGLGLSLYVPYILI